MWFKWAAILIGIGGFSLVLASPALNNSPLSKYIVGGKPITIDEAPHQVSLHVLTKGFQCGGSIISKEWIVTAAHCAEYPPSYYTVRAGSTYTSYGGSTHKVDKIHIHPTYLKYIDAEAPVSDIAVMHVKTPFKLDSTRKPIAMFDDNEKCPDDSYGYVTGWGSDNVNPKTYQLHGVAVPIYSTFECKRTFFTDILDKSEICAGYPQGGKDACSGDSGGPLTVDGRLAGIVSWGEGCAQPRRAGVYTEVAYYRDWVKHYTSL